MIQSKRFCESSRLLETSEFSELSLEQLVEKLAESDDLEEQTDILHYLVLCFGLKQKITVPNVSFVHVLSQKILWNFSRSLRFKQTCDHYRMGC